MKFSLIHHGLGDWEVRKSSFSRLNGAHRFKILADVMADHARSHALRVAARQTARPPYPRIRMMKRRRGWAITLHSHSHAPPPRSLSLTSASPLSHPRHAQVNRNAMPLPPHLYRARSLPPPCHCLIARAHRSAITSSSPTTHCLNPSQGKCLRASLP